MSGGDDADTFMFGASHGNDTITDFEDGTDIIDLSALDGVASMDDLTITANGNDAVINTGQGTLTLTGVSTDDLDADDFVFSTTGEGTILLEGVELGDIDEDDFVFYEALMVDGM